MVAVLRLLILANFNPRSLTGTTFWMAALALISLFQSSLPYGSDFFTPPIVQSASDFNPRSLTGATVRITLYLIPAPDFNPRSLTGATASFLSNLRKPPISIHAPLRERRQCFTHFLGIFNFNPRSNDAPMRPHFNPRSLAGATDCSCLLIFRRIHFNPRSLTGATKDHKLTVVSVKFQSTLPRGSDFSSDVNNRIRHYFNPRSLAGATQREL